MRVPRLTLRASCSKFTPWSLQMEKKDYPMYEQETKPKTAFWPWRRHRAISRQSGEDGSRKNPKEGIWQRDRVTSSSPDPARISEPPGSLWLWNASRRSGAGVVTLTRKPTFKYKCPLTNGWKQRWTYTSRVLQKLLSLLKSLWDSWCILIIKDL